MPSARTSKRKPQSTNGSDPSHGGREYLDVLIVGGGLSGIGAAVHLSRLCPNKSYAVLEARDRTGGTWDLFRYPGIRSDSDMFTLGYDFKPWKEAKAIADGPSILSYIRETAQEHGVEEKIRTNHRVVSAAWSTEDARWTVSVDRLDTGETIEIECNFLHFCAGYYDYDSGYMPEFPGVESFEGTLIHPQKWPEDFDYSGKRVVIIGSGATAITLVPAMAREASHVTMLQRSPSYIFTLPARDPIADVLRRYLPAKVAYNIVRAKNVFLAMATFQLSRRRPSFVKKVIRASVSRQLPDGYDIDKHFKPTYNPWDQRVCLVPDGDFFRSIRKGKATVVTDQIERFTKDGILLKSGERIAADVVVSATGLNLKFLGGAGGTIDGQQLALSERISYNGAMLSGVPNAAYTVGYTNASWTLKADLVSRYICRLLNHMDENGYNVCTPEAPAPGTKTEPIIDFSSGYVLRAVDQLPKQGERAPWRLRQNYPLDVLTFRRSDLDDGSMNFQRVAVRKGTKSAPNVAA